MAAERDEYPAWMMGALAERDAYRGDDEPPLTRISPADPAIDTFRERYAPFSTDPRDRLLPQPRPRGFPVQPGYQERYGDPSKVISQVAPGSLAAQDRIVPPPVTPAEEMRRKELGALHGMFVEPVQQAFNIGKMTPQEQEDLAFNAAGNLLPMGKAAAVIGVGAKVAAPRMGDFAKPFYSAATQAIKESVPGRAVPEQMYPTASWLSNIGASSPSARREVEWARKGGEPPGPYATPGQMQGFIGKSTPELGEVRKGDSSSPEAIEAAKRAYKEFDDYNEFLAGKYNINPYHSIGMYRRIKNIDPAEVAKYDELKKLKVDTQNALGTPTKFGSPNLVLPGGENYRETLLTLPTSSSPALQEFNKFKQQLELKHGGHIDSAYDASRITGDSAMADRYEALLRKAQDEHRNAQSFTGSHWEEPNVLAHYRTNDRDIGGKKTLFLEEVQSDWHQKGRREGYSVDIEQRKKAISDQLNALTNEYMAAPLEQRGLIAERMNTLHDQATVLQRGEAVPDAPFKTTWHELALKRAIRDAAEGGYDQLAWTPGSVQNARYDLSKQISNIQYNTSENTLQAFDKNRNMVMNSRVEPKDLPDHIGKDAADKILNNPTVTGKDRYGVWHHLSGVDLQIGGEGMRGFYDKMLPAAANKLGKPHGAQVGQVEMQTNPQGWHLTPPDQNIHGKWMVKSNNYNSRGDIFDSKAEAEAFLSDRIAGGGGAHAVHTLPITPSLREQALRKGFPLFVVGGTATVGGLAAQDNYAQ